MDKSVIKAAQEFQVFADEPWALKLGEEAEHYEMFKEFRDSRPHERPMLLHILAAKYGKTPRDVKEIALHGQWNYRASRYDLWQEASFRKGVQDKKRILGMRLTQLSETILEKSEKAFKALEDDEVLPSYREAVEMARLGIELQRAGFGLSDVIAKTDNENDRDGPAQYIEAAIQISAIVRRKLTQVEVDPNDVIDGTVEVDEEEPFRVVGDAGDVP